MEVEIIFLVLFILLLPALCFSALNLGDGGSGGLPKLQGKNSQ